MVSPGDTHSLKIMEFLSSARTHKDIHKSAVIVVFRLDVLGKRALCMFLGIVWCTVNTCRKAKSRAAEQ